MNKADVAVLMTSVAGVVREFVDNAVGALLKRVDALAEVVAIIDQRFAGLPVVKDGLPGSSAFQIACLGGFQGSEGEWLESLRGKDGAPGESAFDIARKHGIQDGDALFGVATEAGFLQLLRGKTGDPGKVDYTQIAEKIAEMVKESVAQIPKPDAGKDADPAEIVRAVADAVAAIPKPKDAEVDYERVGVEVSRMVSEALAAIPVPKDGDSVDPEAVREMIAVETARAVGLLPKPEPGNPGKDADAELVRVVVAEILPGMVDKAQAMLGERLDVAVVAEVAKIPPAKPGKNADPVHPDTVALMVVTEVAKVMEKAVAAIPKPKDGDRGRDAIECEPLLSIDEAKSYQRGTYAAHRGGTIRSFRQTDPITEAGLMAAGWAVMADGVAGIAIETAEDMRTAVVSISRTGGEVVTHRMTLPVVIHRNVWVEGKSYAKGDSVTWGGSTWIAQRDTDSKPDSADGSWVLSVKRGRDGADAKVKP